MSEAGFAAWPPQLYVGPAAPLVPMAESASPGEEYPPQDPPWKVICEVPSSTKNVSPVRSSSVTSVVQPAMKRLRSVGPCSCEREIRQRDVTDAVELETSREGHGRPRSRLEHDVFRRRLLDGAERLSRIRAGLHADNLPGRCKSERAGERCARSNARTRPCIGTRSLRDREARRRRNDPRGGGRDRARRRRGGRPRMAVARDRF